MDWVADGERYYASDVDNQYLLQEDGAGWVIMVLEILDEGKLELRDSEKERVRELAEEFGFEYVE